jgi:FtsZ-binding cell division protein ZapB
MHLFAIPPIVGTLKAMPALSIATFLWAEGAAISLGDKANLIFNVLTVGFVLYVIFRGGKSRLKDETIKDLQASVEGKDIRVKTLAEDLREARQQTRQIEHAAGHCKEEATRWQAKYEEAKQYTAREAVEHFDEALARHSTLVAERHAVLIQQGEQTTLALAQVASTLASIEERLTRS